MTQPRKRASATSSSGRRSGSAASPAKRAATGSGRRSADSSEDGRAGGNGRSRSLSPARIARAAAEQLTEIMGAEADSISGLERSETGWLVRVEVVEVRRIPDSTSVLACYQVAVDDNGELQSYRREHRYYRNQAGDS